MPLSRQRACFYLISLWCLGNPISALAEGAALVEVFSDKAYIPPSGDKRDYMSLAIYWWPNALTKIPYIYRDGVRNPESDNYDAPRLEKFIRQIGELTTQYQQTGDPALAQEAATRIRQWFLDPEKRMNPNLNYAQFIPGIRNGSSHGIVETNHLASRFLDDLQVLAQAGAITSTDLQGLRSWFGEYLEWLENSPNGQEQDRQENNHSLWYDYQRVRYALFLEDPERAKKILQEVGPRRIAKQIRPDGSMPAEMLRTKSYSYVCYALTPLLALAEIGLPHGINLYAYEDENGGSLRKALLYTLRHAVQPDSWPGKEIDPIDADRILRLARKYLSSQQDTELETAVKRMRNFDIP